MPGTVGLTVRDRTDMVFVEYARSPRAVGLFSVVGTRVSLPLSAAGRAYIAAMAPSARMTLLAELDAALPEPAARLRKWLQRGVPRYQRHRFVVSCGDWHPHINGLAMPIHHPATQSTVVLGIGVLASVYGAERLSAEVGPILLEAGTRVAALLTSTPDTALPNPPASGPSRSAHAP